MPSVIQTTPSLGASIGAIVNTLNPIKQAPLGTVLKGADGHDYIYAQASAVIAATGNVAVVLTEPAMTVATGAGAWTWVPTTALAIGDRAWFKKTAI